MAKDADVSTSIENGVLTITVKGFDPFVIDPETLPRELIEQAALHGFKQKYVDAAALGREATLADKHREIKRLIDHHATTGDWNRTSAGDGTTGDGLLVRAIQEFDGCSRDDARALVSKMDKKLQAKMRASAELAPIIARLKLDKAPKAPANFDPMAELARIKAGASVA